MKAIDLRTAALRQPMGIDLPHPAFSWKLEGGLRQTACRIRAARSLEALLSGKTIWDTGKTEGGSMRGHSYTPGLVSRERVWWQVKVWDENGLPGPWSEPVWFETGLLSTDDWSAKWIAGDYDPQPGTRCPVDLFRRGFAVDAAVHGGVKTARLYASALGVYQMFLGERRVGDEVLTPGPATYEARIPYQVYDVADLLTEGENAWTIQLGDGWYRGKMGAFGASCVYGDTTAIIGQLEITYADGATQTVRTGEDFSWCNDGPVRMNDMKDGGIVDLRYAPGYWGRARLLPDQDRHTALLRASNSVPALERERFHPRVLTTPDGGTVLDFGQNIQGYVAFSIQGEAGHRARMQLGEMLDADGNFTVKNLITEEIAPHIPDYCDDSHFQTIEVICDGQRHAVKPGFTVQGFQYVKLTDWPEPVDLKNFTAIAVYSDMDVLADFSCSNPDIEALVRNTLWSVKGNHLYVPTDCPTRERSAWLGDAQLFFDTGAYFMDFEAFYRKWLQDIYDDQAADGKLYNIVPRCAPHEGGNLYVEGSSGWTDAGILIPWRHYRQYGDRSVLEAYYPGMKRLIGFLTSRMGDESDPELDKRLPPHPLRKYVVTAGFHFGEWNEPGSTLADIMAPKDEVATAYLAYSLGLFSEISRLLGEDDEATRAEALAANVRAAYNHYYVSGGIRSSRMCEYVRPLALGLIDDPDQRRRAAEGLAGLVEESGCHVGTGFLSTPFLLPVLSEYGYADLAWRMLENPEYPSWIHEVRQGATTVWENWDGIASRNHYSNGAVCEWIFGTACGIRVAGENRFEIAPSPGGTVSAMGLRYRSCFGEVSCHWRRTQRGTEYRVHIPAGCTAEVRIQGMETFEAEAGDHVFVVE